jgi:quercetin dioxygenase-like cupin family protein
MSAPDFDAPLDLEMVVELAEALRPVELSVAERDRMRSRILKRVLAVPPAGTLTVRAAEGAWQDHSPGVRLKVLREEPALRSMTFLLRLEPGAQIPVHSHSMEEHCYVLEGEAVVGDQVIRAGDWHVALPGTEHREFFSKTGCLILVRGEIRDRG